jgi:hypothetical protein
MQKKEKKVKSKEGSRKGMKIRDKLFCPRVRKMPHALNNMLR